MYAHVPQRTACRKKQGLPEIETRVQSSKGTAPIGGDYLGGSGESMLCGGAVRRAAMMPEESGKLGDNICGKTKWVRLVSSQRQA